ncbi:hypothetical protein [Thermococcus sp.]
MAKYALWYFKPQWGNYGTFDTNMPTSRLSDLGFDYMIALHTCGKNCQFGQMPMSGYTYEAGYNDGKNLARWIEGEVTPELPYLVEIPVLVRENDEQWEALEDYGIPPKVRNLDYLRGWVDGVYTNTGGFEKGFYWNLEFPWQVVRGVVSESVIRELSEKILAWGQQFVWIPYFHYSYPDHISDITKTDIGRLAKYFTYIFVQPNYYQGKTKTLQDFDVVFNQLEELKEENNLNNIFMEMECDDGVRIGKCFDDESSEECKKRACDYVRYTKDYPHRAYYYQTNVRNLQEMEEYCNDHGKRYIF